MLSPAVLRLIDLALEEDLGRGDVTSEAVLDAAAVAAGAVVAREPLVLAGIEIAEQVFLRVEPRLVLRREARDGDDVAAGARVLAVAGPARGLLAAERTALNFLQRLSGVATLTRAFVRAAEGTRARIADTRKTTPGWRALEKAAVRAGGGANHRADLAAGLLIKDNHIAAAGGVGAAVARARRLAPHGLRIECEVTSEAELEAALAAGADALLLDNMTPAEVRIAVRRIAGRALVEVSGGVRLENVRAYAEAGADVISVGRLTHSAPAVDLSLDVANDAGWET